MVPLSNDFDIRKDAAGREYMEVQVDGAALLRVALANKGTAFTLEEREALGLEGLLPPQVNTLEQQVERAWRGLLMSPTPLTRYQFLRALQERQETLFYAVLCKHLRELLPIVYTPTVGDAVKQFSALYQHPRGLTVSPDNVDRVHAMVARHPLHDVRMIVATDSSAILGIGDQGCGGMAIPIGKLSLYTAAGGVSPHRTLPVTLDVGTDRTDLIDDPMYLGVRQRRLTGDAYLAFIDRFVDAVKQRWPDAIIQWEDLSKDAAFTVLERYRKVVPSFNDDIQGTGAVVLAGALSACRLRGESLADQHIVIHGAGAGGIGVAWTLHQGMVREGLSPEEARARICVLDSRGLLVDDRPMEPYKRPWAQRRSDISAWAAAGTPELLETVRGFRPTMLLGLSGQRGVFTEEVVRAMAECTERPVIFPLSNPTHSSEALPADLIAWTQGKAIVAAGSPFEPVTYEGRTFVIGQGNNAFIFPGLGFGAIVSKAREITDGMVMAAAYVLADYTAERCESDRVYPDVDEMQVLSQKVAAAVIRQAMNEGVAATPISDPEAAVNAAFWTPGYLPVVRAATGRMETAAARRMAVG